MQKINNLIEGTSIAYFLAYKCLMERNQEVTNYYYDSFSIYIFPAVTMAAFSCEVALKNHLSKVGIAMGGHNLKKLFYALPTIAQDKYAITTVRLENCLSATLNKEPIFGLADFEKALDRCRLTFTKCRYLYEGIQDIDIDFVETFMFALNDEADQYESFLNKKIGK